MRKHNYSVRISDSEELFNDDNFLNGKRAIYEDRKGDKKYMKIKDIQEFIFSLSTDDYFRIFEPYSCYKMGLDGAIQSHYTAYRQDDFSSIKWFNMLELKYYIEQNISDINEALYEKYSDALADIYDWIDSEHPEYNQEYMDEFGVDGEGYNIDSKTGEPVYNPYEDDYYTDYEQIISLILYGDTGEATLSDDDFIYYTDADYIKWLGSASQRVRMLKLKKLDKISKKERKREKREKKEIRMIEDDCLIYGADGEPLELLDEMPDGGVYIFRLKKSAEIAD